MHNQNTAYFASQVQFNTMPNVMMPSKTWMDAITMFHHPTRVRVRVKDIQADDYHYIDPRGKPNLDSGQTERGPGHYAARHYPHQHEARRGWVLQQKNCKRDTITPRCCPGGWNYKSRQDLGLVQDHRNRKLIRVTLPPLRRGAVNQDTQLLIHSPGDNGDDHDDDDDYCHHAQEQGRQDPPAVTEHVLPQHTPQTQEPLKLGLQSDQLPEVSHTPQAEARDPHQQNGHYYCHRVQEDTPPQGPYKVGPPEPYSEASQKQTQFVNEQTSTFPHSM